jgi:V/A-type H+-transporting ATPase subunit A
MGRLFEDAFLRQNALDPADGYCSPRRQFKLLHLLLHVHRRGLAAVDRGAAARTLVQLPITAGIAAAKSEIGDADLEAIDRLESAAGGEYDAAAAAIGGRHG